MARTVACPRQSRDPAGVVDDPSAVVLLQGSQAVEIGGDYLLGKQVPRWPAGAGGEVERVQHLVLGAAGVEPGTELLQVVHLYSCEGGGGSSCTASSEQPLRLGTRLVDCRLART